MYSIVIYMNKYNNYNFILKNDLNTWEYYMLITISVSRMCIDSRFYKTNVFLIFNFNIFFNNFVKNRKNEIKKNML